MVDLSIVRLSSATRKYVEAEWEHYHETLEEIDSLKESILHPYEPDVNVSGGQNSVRTITKETEDFAIRLTTHKQLNHLQEITGAIETVYHRLPEDKQRLVQYRYWSKEDLTWDEVAKKCYISRRQALRWRDQIIIATISLLGWR